MSRKFIITGASGYVASHLVPTLSDSGCDLLLVGRNIQILNEKFPNIPNCTYQNLANHCSDYNEIIHLAVLNNHVTASLEKYNAVNVDLLAEVIEIAKANNIKKIFNISSIHALDDNNTSHYAVSKRNAANLAKNTTGVKIHTLYLPVVYGSSWGGKLKLLNSIPSFIAKPIFKILAAAKVTLSVEVLAVYFLDLSDSEQDKISILSDKQEENFFYMFSKKLIDLAAAGIILLFLGWIFLIIWIIIRIDSPGPGIFRQTRVGKNQKYFTCYKFRTMKKNTAQLGTHELSGESVTAVGKILRKYKIDELPQIINIFRNEISLVGPRPSLPSQSQLVRERNLRQVLNVKPGITGLAQIEGIDMSDPVALATRDAVYVNTRTILSDVKIILATVLGQGRGDKVNTKHEKSK